MSVISTHISPHLALLHLDAHHTGVHQQPESIKTSIVGSGYWRTKVCIWPHMRKVWPSPPRAVQALCRLANLVRLPVAPSLGCLTEWATPLNAKHLATSTLSMKRTKDLAISAPPMEKAALDDTVCTWGSLSSYLIMHTCRA